MNLHMYIEQDTWTYKHVVNSMFTSYYGMLCSTKALTPDLCYAKLIRFCVEIF